MRYLSVCSGCEAATLAWHVLGWEPVAFAEIEAQPSAVLARRYPDIPNLGDFTGIRNHWLRRIGIEPGTIDLLVGGTPCQNFSVAGLRGGMADARGNLALEFLRLARRVRPEWVVWENVPGVLSSYTDEAASEASEESCRDVEAARRLVIEAGIDLGTDFGVEEFEEVDQTNDLDCFIAGLEELGYGWAFRILDAQHIGVPQRRRRIFVVGYSGVRRGLAGAASREDIQRFSRVSAAVLFERHSLSGNPPPSREAGSVVTSSLTRSLGNGGADTGRAQAGHLTVSAFSSHGHGQFREGLGMATARDSRDGFHAGLVAHTLRAEGADASEDGTGRGVPLVACTLGGGTGSRGWCDDLDRAGAFIPTPYTISAAESCEVQSHGRETDTARSLDGTGGFAANQGGTVIAYQCHDSNVGPMGTIRSGHNEGSGVPFVVAPTLQASEGGASNGYVSVIPFDTTQITSGKNHSSPKPGDPCHPLTAVGDPPTIAFSPNGSGKQTSLGFSEAAPTVKSTTPIEIIGQQGVRRLTPVEAERLQGMPDDWTLVPYRGKPMADGPRYKMIGNSMAIPVMLWIGRRIEAVRWATTKSRVVRDNSTDPSVAYTHSLGAPRSRHG